MLQYYAFDFFAPVIVSPEMSSDEKEISIYVVADDEVPYKYANLIFNIYRWDSNSMCPVKTLSRNVSVVRLFFLLIINQILFISICLRISKC